MSETFVQFSLFTNYPKDRCSCCGCLLTNDNKYHGTNKLCKSCHNQMCKKYRVKKRATDPIYVENEKKRAKAYYHNVYQKRRDDWLSEYRTPCLKCGETRSWCIVWHHIDPATKSMNIGHGTPSIKMRERIIGEISKCVNLCDNCHREFHHIYGHKPEHPKEALEEYLGFTLNREDSNDRTLCPSNCKHI